MREGPDGRAEGAGKSEIGELQAPIAGHQKVLGLQITVHNATSVAECKASEALEQIRLRYEGRGVEEKGKV